MNTTSINIQPVTAGSELHNHRLKKLDYVRPELEHLNQIWSISTIENRLEMIKENYTRTTGQSMQKKATPIREGVVVINENTTISDLKMFARKAEEKFGIKAFQIYIHRDEGHQKDGVWKCNQHAHIVFDWTQANGKSCKLNKQDMAMLQTILSEELKMNRGVSSDAKHLSAIQFKNLKEEEKKLQLKQELKELSNQVSIEQTKTAVKTAVFKGAERFKDFLGVSINDEKKNELEREVTSLKAEIKQREREIHQLNLDKSRLRDAYKSEKEKSDYNLKIIEQLRSELLNFKTALKELGKLFSKEQITKLTEILPIIGKHMAKDEPKQNRSRGLSM